MVRSSPDAPPPGTREAGDGEEAKALAAGAVELGLRLPPSEVERLLAFLAELRRWNRAYNLVSDAPRLEWVRSHVLDSLSIAPRLAAIAEGADRPGLGFEGGPSGGTPHGGGPFRVLDLGSGAGLPGIPLGIALPELRFVLLDGTGKKVRFCRHAATALGLRNVEVVEARAERYAPRIPFDAVVVRAVGALERVRALVRPYCRGPILAMKGRYPARELEALEGVPFEAVRLRVPGLEAERHLVILR